MLLRPAPPTPAPAGSIWLYEAQALFPGDVVLLEAFDGTRWTHAAISDGTGGAWQAVLGRGVVRLGELLQCPTYVFAPQPHSVQALTLIAQQAGKPYDAWGVAQFGVREFIPSWLRRSLWPAVRPGGNPKSFFCSSLIAWALMTSGAEGLRSVGNDARQYGPGELFSMLNANALPSWAVDV